MLIVHHLNNSRSQRILWLLEELGLEYEIKRYERDSETMLAPPELKKIHPLGKSPVVTDGDITVAESGAIIEYLVKTHGAGRFMPPDGTPEQRQFTYWLHYAEGSVMSPLLLKLIFSKIPDRPMPFFVKPIARMVCDGALKGFVNPQIKLHMDYIDAHLGQSAWFTGSEFTAADVQMSFALEGGMARNDSGQEYANIKAFLEQIHGRPAYKRALERGGEYSLLT